MKDIVFATNNENKLKEVRAIVGHKFNILSLKDIGCSEDIAETASTFEGNALIKARYVHEKYGYDCFADDSGLEVEALGNAPGVFSARYAGEPSDSRKNIVKLLQEMQGVKNRKARFRTCIALIYEGEESMFEGSIEGSIIEELRGCNGFGYDPLFMPAGYELTFAEMSSDEKNKISHRALATNKLIEYLLIKN